MLDTWLLRCLSKMSFQYVDRHFIEFNFATFREINAG